MPDVAVTVFLDAPTVATIIEGGRGVEVDLDTISTNGTVSEIEIKEVTLPEVLPLEGMVLNVNNSAPGLLVLPLAGSVPGGTPVGTVVLRKST